MDTDAENSLMNAVGRRDYIQVKKLIANGVSLNFKNYYENIQPNELVPEPDYGTPLYFAILNLDYEMVKLLLINNADPNYPLSGGANLVEVLFYIILLKEVLRNEIADINNQPALKHLNRIQINKATLLDVGKILDILLAYNINTEFELTAMFKGVCNQISSKIFEMQVEVNDRKTIINDKVDAMDPRQHSRISMFFKKILAKAIIKTDSYSTKISLGKIPQLLTGIIEIQERLNEVKKEIEDDRYKFIARRRDALEVLISKLTKKLDIQQPQDDIPQQFPTEVIEHIISFEKNYAKEVANLRLFEKRITKIIPKDAKPVQDIYNKFKY